MHKEKIIRATIRRLPVTVVLPFLRKVGGSEYSRKPLIRFMAQLYHKDVVELCMYTILFRAAAYVHIYH